MWASWGSSNRPSTRRAGWKPRLRPISRPLGEPRAASWTPERINSPGVASAPAATTTTSAADHVHAAVRPEYSTPVASGPAAAILDHHTAHIAVGPQLEPALSPRRMDVGVHRRLAGVRRAALQARAAAHAVARPCRRSPARVRRRSPRSPGTTVWTHCCQSVRSRTPSRRSTRSRWGSRSVSANGSPPSPSRPAAACHFS